MAPGCLKEGVETLHDLLAWFDLPALRAMVMLDHRRAHV